MELSLREVLGIARKEFHDSIVDLVKRKRLSTKPEPEKPVEARTMHLQDMAVEDELAESHYSSLYWGSEMCTNRWWHWYTTVPRST